MELLAAGLGLALLAAIVRFFFLFKDIKHITKELGDLNEGRTKKRITTSSGNKHIEALCERINESASISEQYSINARTHEEKLRQSIASVSHDLRTPLASILGYTSMMKKEGTLNVSYLQTIEGRANALCRLVEEFYELSVIDDEKYDMPLERIDIVEIAATSILEHHALFEGKSVSLEVELPEKALWVLGNALALERVIQNLIQNAVKFARDSARIIILEEDEHLIFQISNNSDSLEKADLPFLFDRFYTVDKARGSGNTGLGLHIVKTLLQKMDAALEASLEEGWFSVRVLLRKEKTLD
ncbi:MAG: HAMP domain-containing histidine kinase [Clostridiales bacterium]|jgi:signal transduction histidine kinase|nr:HAMP domain-containing histidine kinase [Clostridiales bacterium]